MLKEILLDGYKNLFMDIINEYNNIIKKNNCYDNYLKIIKHEIKEIISAFEMLLVNKKNTFRSLFKDEYESILHAIDKTLFNHIESIFENVSLLLSNQ